MNHLMLYHLCYSNDVEFRGKIKSNFKLERCNVIYPFPNVSYLF